MSKRGHIPIRTCIGCRKKRKKEEMIWLAQTPEGVVVVHPVRNSSRASNPAGTVLGYNPTTGGTSGQRGIVSNGVNARKPHQGRGFYLCPDFGCLNKAKKKNRGVGFLETMDFLYPTAKGFLTEEGGNDEK